MPFALGHIQSLCPGHGESTCFLNLTPTSYPEHDSMDLCMLSAPRLSPLLLSCGKYTIVMISFPPIKSTGTSPSLVCFQVLGVESRIKRHHLKKSNLQGCYSFALLGQVCLLRRPNPVRYVSQSWETFCTWLKSKEQMGSRNYTNVRPVGKNSISLLTYSSTRSSTLERILSCVILRDPHSWRPAQFTQQEISLPTWRLGMTSWPSWEFSHRPLILGRNWTTVRSVRWFFTVEKVITVWEKVR